MPRKRITPGAREGLLATLTVALEQPTPEAYQVFFTGAGGAQGAKIQKPFTDYLNVLQWLHTAVSSCKEDEVITSYCARVDLVIKRGTAYYETHLSQQVVEGNRTRRAPVRFGE